MSGKNRSLQTNQVKHDLERVDRKTIEKVGKLIVFFLKATIKRKNHDQLNDQSRRRTGKGREKGLEKIVKKKNSVKETQ